MILLSILAMTAVVFLSRYLFLSPKLPLKLNGNAQRLLSYSSPAVLTAIWAPIVFIHDDRLSVSYHNPYLIAAILAAFIAWKTKNVIATTVLSMLCFFVLNSWIL
ncbi:AzlD domain-containing protein [Vibrio algivorus]|uniref:AzlD domain-containing protein n=1 Tax=Vibrio algivorus TaxID=1667024 RepID=A0A557P9R4_9VIBR|nr:AzlD domain-containing protein [Vibrio algivorus]TVO37391.1 AzlD domain-containing protein [Vibrio algivorus]GLT13851.1 branched-chain amino acid ABC transporter [Vibrio algivorus]